MTDEVGKTSWLLISGLVALSLPAKQLKTLAPAQDDLGADFTRLAHLSEIDGELRPAAMKFPPYRTRADREMAGR
jgi:hypothetical protein